MTENCLCGVCAECQWWQRNSELGGDPAPIGESVDHRHGLANAITLLPAIVVEDRPVITFGKEATGRYRVQFDYEAQAVDLLKATVPGSMRRWNPEGKQWEISADWTGPLAFALRNAGFDITGLDEDNITDWFGWFSVATPVGEEGHRAYRKGICATCTTAPHRPGCVECGDCLHQRLTRQYRVTRVLAEKGLAPWPQTQPAKGKARHTRAPLVTDHGEAEIIKRDYMPAVDAAIVARRDQTAKPPCPICGRRPAKSAVVHAGCRTRLLHALSGRPFLRTRNKAFQAGLCTVCLTRPHRPPGYVTCAHCAEFIAACNQAKGEA